MGACVNLDQHLIARYSMLVVPKVDELHCSHGLGCPHTLRIYSQLLERVIQIQSRICQAGHRSKPQSILFDSSSVNMVG